MIELRGVDKKLLELLSENPRIKIAELSRKLKISRNRTKKKLERLEKELGIKYTIELNEEREGIELSFMVIIKLKKEIDEKYIKKIFSKSYIPQFVAVTKGDFDLFIYGIAQTKRDYDFWEVDVRQKLYGFVENWDNLLILSRRISSFPVNEKIIKKSKLKQREKEIIIELNKNSRISLKDLAKKVNISKPLLRHYLDYFEKEKIIKYDTILSERTYPSNLITLRDLQVPQNFTEINKKFRNVFVQNIKNIPYASRLIGNFNHCTITSFSSAGESYEFEKKISNAAKTMIGKSMSAFILKIVIGNLFSNHFVKEEIYHAPKY